VVLAYRLPVTSHLPRVKRRMAADQTAVISQSVNAHKLIAHAVTSISTSWQVCSHFYVAQRPTSFALHMFGRASVEKLMIV
jgi:hypothetical protein